LTNSSGAVTDTYSYTAFGELFNQTGTTTNNYLYTGQQFDSLTGLYDLRARYYNPALGRLLSQDTYPVNFSNPVELNRYVYAANDPIKLIDPSGHEGLLGYGLTSLLNGVKNAAIIITVGVGIVAVTYAIYRLVGTQEATMAWQRILAMEERQSQMAPDENQNPTPFPPPLPRQWPQTPMPTPQQTPQPTPERCNPTKFENWWMGLPIVPGSYQPGQDWYQYEQSVARANGLYGDYARTVSTVPVNADGIEPSECFLVDGKYITNTSLYEQWNKTGTSPWKGFSTQLLYEMLRYRNAIQVSNGIPGAQPRGLVIRTNKDIARRYFEDHLRKTGFRIGVNGYVEIWQ